MRKALWRQCIRRRTIHTIPPLSQQPAEVPPPKFANKAIDLARILGGDNPGPLLGDLLHRPSEPTPSSRLKNNKTISKREESLVAAKPVPVGYNEHAYREAIEVVKEGREPTRRELTDLLQLMDFDSPYGEMKDEARAVWQEMRSRGIVPLRSGYIALLNVTPPYDVLTI